MTRLSTLQHVLLRTFAEASPGYHMTYHEAQRYDQRPYRSALIRGYIVYRPGRGFHLTRAGRAAWEEFQSTEIWRKNPHQPLTEWFEQRFSAAQRTPFMVRGAA